MSLQIRARTATKRSSKVGRTLDSISGVASSARGKNPNSAEKKIAKTVPTTTDLIELAKSLVSPITRPNDDPIIGVIRGETNIAPIITAVLLAISPNAAINAEVDNNR